MSEPSQDLSGRMSRDDGPQRRITDVDPAVQLAIDHGDQDVRHWARGELAVIGTEIAQLGQKIDQAALESTREHAEVKAHLGQLSREQTETKVAVTALQQQVNEMQTADREESAATAAVDRLRSDIQSRTWNWRTWIPSVVAAACALYAVVTSN